MDNAKNLAPPNTTKIGNGKKWLLAFAAVAALIFLARSCYHHKAAKKDLYIIAKDSTWYPQQLYGRDRNLTAFTNDLLAAIAKESKLNIRWAEAGPSTLMPGLDGGAFDAVISPIKLDPYNQGKYLFSEPLFKTGLVLVVPIDSDIHSIKDVEGERIGITTTAPPFSALKINNVNPLNVIFITYYDLNRGLEAVSTGALDGFFVDAISAYSLLSSIYRGKLKVVSATLTDEGFRLVTLQTDEGTRLIEEINSALKKIREDGRYNIMINTWSLFNPDLESMKKEK